jgi:uncharacterized SAM-binding protein YcdF (DUF218 family)
MTSTRRRKWILVLGFAFLVVAAYGTSTYLQVRAAATRDAAGPADLIVVLGAAQYNGRPSPVFQTRLDHALDLFNSGYANVIVTTGSYGPDPNFSEAHVGTEYLSGKGVDRAQIITEQGSGTTYDTVVAVTRLMRSNGWHTAVIVSDGFHLYRVARIFEDNQIAALGSPVPASLIETSRSTRAWYSLREVLLITAYRLGISAGVS